MSESDALSHSPPRTSRALLGPLRLHPKHRTFALWYSRYMVLIAFVAASFIYLQAAIIMENKSSENVSMPSYIMFLIVALSWLTFGLLWTDWVVSLSGMVATIGAILALVAAVSYRPSSSPGAFVAVGS